MHSLSTSEILAAWEHGLSQAPVERALTILAASHSEAPPDELAKLSIGQRDARLLSLREQTFGPQMVGLANCPGCAECLELSFNTEDMRARNASESTIFSLTTNDYNVEFRLPNSFDLLGISGCNDISEARDLLLKNCLLNIEHDGETKTQSTVPGHVTAAIVERMAEVDPQADVQLALTCPMCGHEWQASFDVASFFWSEINALAHHILSDVHTLASVYGWREADILAMTQTRRQAYLEMLNQ